MTLGSRKLIIVSLAAGLFLVANLWMIVNWLDGHGVIAVAKHVRQEYLTGTAITIIVVLLILLVGPGRTTATSWFRRCSVCGDRLGPTGSYCSGCGSKV